MKKLERKFQKLECRDFYDYFAQYVLEQKLGEYKDIEYFDVSVSGDGDLLIIIRVNGKTKKYSVPVLSVVDFEACEIAMDKVLDLNSRKIEGILYKLVKGW